MEEEKIKRAYFSILPANVRYDKSLPPNAKLLYSEITALCNEKGYCWATNSYFAELYEVKPETVSEWISKLVKKKYIYREIIYKDGTKQILKRYLKLSEYPIPKKMDTPIPKKPKENNKDINNTINIYKNKTQNFEKREYQNLDSLFDNL